MTANNIFVHHVFFYLKRPGNTDDLRALIDGLQKLSSAESIKMFHIGRPAATDRPVIEKSYAVSWLLFFDGPESQDAYQRDPVHLHFVDTCSHLWEKVVIYDSIDA